MPTLYIKPQETEPCKKQLPEEFDRLSKKISELQAKSPNTLSLNESANQPKK